MSETPPPPPGRPPAPPPPPPYQGQPYQGQAPWPPYGQYPYPYPVQERKGRLAPILAVVFAVLFFLSGLVNLLLFFLLLAAAAVGAGGGASEHPDQWVEHVVGGDEQAQDKILVLDVEGIISEAVSSFSGGEYGSVTRIRKALEAADHDEHIKGVLLAVNSPGGGVTDSDDIYKLITDYKQKHDKPIVACFGSLAASGGYYVAAAADHIFAEHTTITGSIGVILSTWKYYEAAQKLGLKPETIISPDTPHKDILSGARETTPEEHKIVLGIVQEMYERFVDIVTTGRKGRLNRDQVKALADGRIYTAQQAKDQGLVDDIGYAEDAIRWLKGRAAIGSARLIKYRPAPSLLDVIRGRPTAALSEILAALPPGLSARTRFLYLWPGY